MAKWKTVTTTDEGHLIIAKSRSGINIHYTKIVVGDGVHSDSTFDVNSILSPRQSSIIKEVKVVGKNTVLVKSILSNRDLSAGYFIREVGIFAVAEDEPENEVLCAIAIAENDKADYWPEFEGMELRLPINMSLATGNSSAVSAEAINTFAAYEIGYDNVKSGLIANNVQDAIDELLTLYILNIHMCHSLNTYPEVLVIEGECSYGVSGYGDPYGGSNGKKLRSTVEYLDRNSIKIYVEKQYNPVKSILAVNKHEYIITFVDSTLSLYVLLFVNDSNGNNSSGNQDITLAQTGKSYFYLELI